MATPRILVIGLGTVGRSLVEELRVRDCEVSVVDLDPARVERVKEDVELAVVMDCTDLNALEEIKAASYDHVVVCLSSSFEAAERTTLRLEDQGARNVINVAKTRQRGEILRKVGSTRVVMPGLLQARNLAVELCDDLIASYRWIDSAVGLVEIKLSERLILQGDELDEAFGEGNRLVAVGRPNADGETRFDGRLGDRVEVAEGESLLIFGEPEAVARAVRKRLS